MHLYSLFRNVGAEKNKYRPLNGSRILGASLLVLGLGLVPSLQESGPAHASSSPCTTVFSGYTAGLTTLNGGAYNASTNPYKISTEEELVYLSWATSFANGTATNAAASPPRISRTDALRASYRQTEDLDLESCLWTPIGQNQHIFNDSNGRFSGIFDGSSRSIRNLKVEVNSGLAGFIGLAFKADIKNLRLIDVDIVNNGGDGISRYAGTGGLVGAIYDTTKISNARVTGQIQSIAYPTGGLVGEIQRTAGAEISRSSAEVTVSATNPLGRVGGLVGVVDVASNISLSFATGSVSGLNRVGGLVGTLAGNIDNSYASSLVTATATSGDGVAGGLVGEKRAATAAVLTNSYARGEVNGRSPVGGLLGAVDSGSVTALETFWDADSTGLLTSAGSIGEAKTLAEMQSFDTFGPVGAAWDITDGWVEFDSSATPPQIWGICSGSTHPFLLWEYESSPCLVPQSESGAPANEPAAERRASSPAIHLDLQVTVGQQISGAPVVIGGEGLAGGSDYSLVVRSTPQTVDSGKASPLGNFSKRVSMPALAPGSYTLTLTAVAPDGSSLSLVQGFTVGADGTVTAMGSLAGSTGSALAATGSEPMVMLWSVGLAMLMMVAGASAVAASRSHHAHAKR